VISGRLILALSNPSWMLKGLPDRCVCARMSDGLGQREGRLTPCSIDMPTLVGPRKRIELLGVPPPVAGKKNMKFRGGRDQQLDALVKRRLVGEL
jgi:hypothetical protein